MTDAEIDARMCAEFWLWFAFTTLIPVNTTARFEAMQTACRGIMSRRGR